MVRGPSGGAGADGLDGAPAGNGRGNTDGVGSGSCTGEGRRVLKGNLVVAPAVHMHSGLKGEVTAQLSAGYEQFEACVAVVPPVNLVKRLLLSQVDVGRRLIRVGVLPGRPDASIEALAEGPERHMPEKRPAHKRPYANLVVVYKHAQLFQFSKCNVHAVALQAVHLTEIQQYATLARVAIAAANSWTLHTVSGTNHGIQKTTKSYGASVEAYCAFGASSESTQVGSVIVQINRHMAVTVLNAEKGPFRRHRRRRRGQPLPASTTALDAAAAEADQTVVREQNGGQAPLPSRLRGDSDQAGGDPDSDESAVGGSSGSDRDDLDEPPSASLAATPRAPARNVSAATASSAAPRTTRSPAASRPQTGARTGQTSAPPRTSPSTILASGAAAAGGDATPPPYSPQTAVGAAYGANGAVRTPHPRKVGKSVLSIYQSAL